MVLPVLMFRFCSSVWLIIQFIICLFFNGYCELTNLTNKIKIITAFIIIKIYSVDCGECRSYTLPSSLRDLLTHKWGYHSPIKNS